MLTWKVDSAKLAAVHLSGDSLSKLKCQCWVLVLVTLTLAQYSQYCRNSAFHQTIPHVILHFLVHKSNISLHNINMKI